MQQRLPRLAGALGLAFALLSGSVGTGVAATPKVGTTGKNLSPDFVSNGSIAAFTVTATNNDTSTISQFYLTEVNANAVYAAVPSQGSCTQSGQLKCAFGQVKPNVTVTVTVAFTTPASGSSATYDFEFSTTGYVIGKNNSHGDAFPVGPYTQSLTTDKNKAGTFVWDTSQLVVQDNSSLGNSNKQSTKVTSPDVQIPVTVSDGSLIPCAGVDVTCPTTFFGETSEVNVNDGQTFTTAFQIVIQLYKPGVNASQVNGVYHYWTDTAGPHDELITTPCSGSPTPTVIPCFSASKLGGQNLQLVVWSFHNGRIGGY